MAFSANRIKLWKGCKRLARMGAAAALSLIPIAHAAPPDIGEEWRLTFESEFERPTNAADRPQFLIEDFDRFARGSDNAKWEYRKGPNKDAYAVEENAFVSLDEETGATWSTVGVSANIVDASFQALSDAITYKLMRSGAPASIS